MTLAAFNGQEALVFGDYLDLGTGKTLRAVPGGLYDVAPASGRVVPEFPEPWFSPVQVEPVETPEEVEPAEAQEPDEDPETEVPREF